MSAPSLTPEAIGLFVLAFVFLSRWLWDYNRARREDAQQFEPKAQPGLHHTFATKSELARVEKEVEKVDSERRQGVAGLHKRIEETERRLDNRIDMVPERTIQLLKDTKGLI